MERVRERGLRRGGRSHRAAGAKSRKTGDEVRIDAIPSQWRSRYVASRT